MLKECQRKAIGQLRKAKEYHQLLKDNPQERRHSMSLQYANKAVNDLQDKVNTAIRLWGEEEDIKQIELEKLEAAQVKASKNTKKQDAISSHFGFFACNNVQFREGYSKAKEAGAVTEGENVVHIGQGLYIPKTKVDSFLSQYK